MLSGINEWPSTANKCRSKLGFQGQMPKEMSWGTRKNAPPARVKDDET